MSNPIVSICCIVYNHEEYLERCFEGILMQQTSFEYEIIVHDDASTDRSADIIRDYQRRFPHIFKTILQTQNQYSQGKKIIPILLGHVTGKYIALCEGDDYWTNPLKLQKQVDYMEAHPGCTLCFHNALIHWDTGLADDQLFAPLEDRDYTGDEFCGNWITPTASFLMRANLRNDYLSFLERIGPLSFGDRPLTLWYAHKGTVHAFPEAMCVYRKHEGAYTHVFNAKKMFGEARSWEKMRYAYDGAFSDAISQKMMNTYILAILRGMAQKDFGIVLSSVWHGFVEHPYLGLKTVSKILRERKTMLKANVNR